MEFRNKKTPLNIQKKIIRDYKNKVKVNKIMDTYNISSGTIYYYLHKEVEKTKDIKQLGGNIDHVYEQTSNQEPQQTTHTQQPQQTTHTQQPNKKEHRTSKKEIINNDTTNDIFIKSSNNPQVKTAYKNLLQTFISEN
jgi:chromosomal replication initiation ATPase DnaA